MRPGRTGGAPWSSGRRTGKTAVTVARARLTARIAASPAKVPADGAGPGLVDGIGDQPTVAPGVPPDEVEQQGSHLEHDAVHNDGGALALPAAERVGEHCR